MRRGIIVRVMWLGVSGAALGAAPGCMLHAGEVRTDELAVERARSAHAEDQVRTLEARVARLEDALATRSEQDLAAQKASERTIARLDRLIAAQEQVALRVEQLQPTTPSVPPEHVAVVATSDAARALRVYLEQLVERAQSGAPPWRGGLSFEKRDALRTLLESERGLDQSNPLSL